MGAKGIKLLAIYFRAGSGINAIYERLLAGIAAEQNVVVDVLCNEVSPNLERMAGVRNRYAVPFSKKMGSWYRKCLRWFGTTPTSDRWSRVAAEVVAEDYDVVVAICAGTQLTPVVCGRHLAQKLGCKFAIYAVDAIPAPGGWVRKRNEYWGKMRIVRRNWSAADYVAAANRYMLEFQLSTFRHKAGLQTSVLYTSSPEEWHNNPVSNRTLFLYTGSLYGLRNPDYLLRAFGRLLSERPDAEFMLVGMGFKLRNINSILTPAERSHITIAPHTNNLAPLFADAKVLLDIDADRKKDPFLSSKIASYLRVNRVVVSETGEDTPSRELFAGYRTIVQCDHSAESVYEGRKHALELAESDDLDFSERKPLVEMFSAENIVPIFLDDLRRLCAQ